MSLRCGVLVAALCFAWRGVPAQGGAPAPCPLVDLSGDAARQVVVDRVSGRYLGHPSTLLLEDGKTILCAYPEGHGQGPIVLRRSEDGGRTWSARLRVPESFATSLETPTLHRVVDAAGKRRVLLWSGLYPARRALSEDDGRSWTQLETAGEFGGIVVMGSVEAVPSKPGRYLAWFHDDGRYLTKGGQRGTPVVFTLYQTASDDGGVTWSTPRAIVAASDVHLCEPGAVRSPDGKTVALLLRENSRRKASHVTFSADEGATWSAPRELAPTLTGDRHVARYAKDGRLVVTFRDMDAASPTKGDWVLWVGDFTDLERGGRGRLRARLMDNHHGWDCGYPGLELLPEGTFVATSYGHWTKGESPWIVSLRLRLDELEARLPR